jgi:hypothetical protein
MTENRLTFFKMPVQGLGIDGLEKKQASRLRRVCPEQ